MDEVRLSYRKCCKCGRRFSEIIKNQLYCTRLCAQQDGSGEFIEVFEYLDRKHHEAWEKQLRNEIKASKGVSYEGATILETPRGSTEGSDILE